MLPIIYNEKYIPDAIILYYVNCESPLYSSDKHYLQNGEDTAYRALEAILEFDLIKVNGAQVPNRMFTSLESIRPVGPFQYYKDFYGDVRS